MSRSLLALVGVFLSLTSLRADEEAQKVLDRAIAAHGGATALERVPRMIRSSSGMAYGNRQENACTTELYCDLPHRSRLEMELTAQKLKLLVVVTPTKGWNVTGGLTQEMAPSQLQEVQAEVYTYYLVSLVPLRDAKVFTLKSIPGIKVQGTETAGILVSKKGQDDVRMFFDKSTGYLVQLQRRASAAGLVRTKDYVFADFKEFDGVKMATSYSEKINGQKTIDLKGAKYRFPSKPDDKQFGQP